MTLFDTTGKLKTFGLPRGHELKLLTTMFSFPLFALCDGMRRL